MQIGPGNLFGLNYSVWQRISFRPILFFGSKILFDPKFFLPKFFLDPEFFGPKIFEPKMILDLLDWGPNFFGPNILLGQIF